MSSIQIYVQHWAATLAASRNKKKTSSSFTYMSTLFCELIHQAFGLSVRLLAISLRCVLGLWCHLALKKIKTKLLLWTVPLVWCLEKFFNYISDPGFLSQSKNMDVRQIGNSELVAGGSANANGCLSFDVAKNWRPVQGLTPLSPQDSWDRIFFFVKSCAFFPQSTFTWTASQNCERNKDQNQNL